MGFGKKSSSPAPAPAAPAPQQLVQQPIPTPGMIVRTAEADRRADSNTGAALLNTETTDEQARRAAAGGTMIG